MKRDGAFCHDWEKCPNEKAGTETITSVWQLCG